MRFKAPSSERMLLCVDHELDPISTGVRGCAARLCCSLKWRENVKLIISTDFFSLSPPPPRESWNKDSFTVGLIRNQYNGAHTRRKEGGEWNLNRTRRRRIWSGSYNMIIWFDVWFYQSEMISICNAKRAAPGRGKKDLVFDSEPSNRVTELSYLSFQQYIHLLIISVNVSA